MKNPFQTLQPWLSQILHTIKRELKTDHLSKNPSFYRTYFGNRPMNRLSSEEIFAAYEKELLQGNEELAEWVVNRWVFNHGEVYKHFAERLSRVNPNFDEIECLDEPQSKEILAGAVDSFGALPVYIFSVLNGVVFPESVLAHLRSQAEKEEGAKAEEEMAAREKETLEQLVSRHQREISRLQEKYEDKIAGVMKKYAIDIEALKKQIRALQQKVNAR
jgi:hypothetical protein